MGSLTDQVETIENPEQPHCATVLILDVSGSMASDGKIAQMNQGLLAFKEAVLRNDLARKRIDLAVVTFGTDVHVLHEFSCVDAFEPSALSAGGLTAMGQAIRVAVDMVEARKAAYKAAGTDYFRPWIWLLTDGEPSDMHPGDAAWTMPGQTTMAAGRFRCSRAPATILGIGATTPNSSATIPIPVPRRVWIRQTIRAGCLRSQRK